MLIKLKTSIKNINYRGTQAEWANINIESYNDSILSATKVYNYTA